jgi:hypothetical protein
MKRRRREEYFSLNMGTIHSSETSVLTRPTRRRHIPEDGILHSHCRANLKSYIALTGWDVQRRSDVSPVNYELGFHKSYIALTDWALERRRNVSPVRYELGLYIPEHDILQVLEYSPPVTQHDGCSNWLCFYEPTLKDTNTHRNVTSLLWNIPFNYHTFLLWYREPLFTACETSFCGSTMFSALRLWRIVLLQYDILRSWRTKSHISM